MNLKRNKKEENKKEENKKEENKSVNLLNKLTPLEKHKIYMKKVYNKNNKYNRQERPYIFHRRKEKESKKSVIPYIFSSIIKNKKYVKIEEDKKNIYFKRKIYIFFKKDVYNFTFYLKLYCLYFFWFIYIYDKIEHYFKRIYLNIWFKIMFLIHKNINLKKNSIFFQNKLYNKNLKIYYEFENATEFENMINYKNIISLNKNIYNNYYNNIRKNNILKIIKKSNSEYIKKYKLALIKYYFHNDLSNNYLIDIIYRHKYKIRINKKAKEFFIEKILNLKKSYNIFKFNRKYFLKSNDFKKYF